MCVHQQHCGGQCPECKETAERMRRRREGTRKMMATKAAKRAEKNAAIAREQIARAPSE